MEELALSRNYVINQDPKTEIMPQMYDISLALNSHVILYVYINDTVYNLYTVKYTKSHVIVI